MQGGRSTQSSAQGSRIRPRPGRAATCGGAQRAQGCRAERALCPWPGGTREDRPWQGLPALKTPMRSRQRGPDEHSVLKFKLSVESEWLVCAFMVVVRRDGGWLVDLNKLKLGREAEGSSAPLTQHAEGLPAARPSHTRGSAPPSAALPSRLELGPQEWVPTYPRAQSFLRWL